MTDGWNTQNFSSIRQYWISIKVFRLHSTYVSSAKRFWKTMRNNAKIHIKLFAYLFHSFCCLVVRGFVYGCCMNFKLTWYESFVVFLAWKFISRIIYTATNSQYIAILWVHESNTCCIILQGMRIWEVYNLKLLYWLVVRKIYFNSGRSIPWRKKKLVLKCCSQFASKNKNLSFVNCEIIKIYRWILRNEVKKPVTINNHV